MKIETLRLRGVLRFRDEVSVDFRDLPPGLIAFVGENGDGKTTLLEAPLAGLYRECPSRSGKELLDYVHGPDAFIETTFALEGHGLYRARLNLDADHRKAEGTLARIDPDGRPVLLNDGKVSTYDVAVRQVLPPPELLLASVFAAQDKAGSFSTLDRRSRRELFAALLGLWPLQEMSDRAKAAGSLVSQAIETLTATRDVLARDTTDAIAQDFERRADALQVEQGQLEVRRRALSREMQDAERALAATQEDALRYAQAKTHLDRLIVEAATVDRQIAANRAAQARLQPDAEAERIATVEATSAFCRAIDVQIADRGAFTSDVDAIVATLAAIIKDADERIAGNRTVQEQADVIRQASAEVAALERELSQLRAAQQALLEEQTAAQERERATSDAMRDLDVIETRLEDAELDASLMTAVPCGGSGEFSACHFLEKAAKAKGEIPALRARLTWRSVRQEELQAARAHLTEIREEIASTTERQKDVTAACVARRPLAAQLPDVSAAEERIASHMQRKADADAEADRQRRVAVARAAQRVADLEHQRTAHAEEGQRQLYQARARCDARSMELYREEKDLLEALQQLRVERHEHAEVVTSTQDASDRAAQQTATLAALRRAWDGTTGDLSRLTSEGQALQRQREAFVARRAELDAVQARIGTLQTDLVEWTLLRKALDKDGLQTLEIDEAGPTVSAYANDLLTSSYGPRFQLELVTQEPKRTKGKNGEEMKDVFEVKVYDARDGGDARDLGDLSGGENVIVSEALKSAIALLVNTRNRLPLRTLFRDETTGALDGENAARYMAMLRRAHELGGFHHTLFVTHSPSCAVMAEGQLRFRGGAVEVALPPYTEAAYA